MNNIPKKDLFLIITSIFFLFFSFYSIYSHFNSSTRDLNNNVSSWNNGIKVLINDLKKSIEITDYSEGKYSFKKFNSPPVLLTSSPDSNLNYDELTYFLDPKNNSLIKKIDSEDILILSNVKQFSIRLLDFKGKETLNIESASGYRIFIMFDDGKRNIPIDFSVFSEYLFSSKKFNGFFDYIDNKRFY